MPIIRTIAMINGFNISSPVFLLSICPHQKAKILSAMPKNGDSNISDMFYFLRFVRLKVNLMLNAVTAKVISVDRIQMIRRENQFFFKISKQFIIPTPAGIKKNAILDKRKSDFSCMCSTLSSLESRQKKRRISPITLAGIGKGRICCIMMLSQQMVNIMPVCFIIFI